MGEAKRRGTFEERKAAAIKIVEEKAIKIKEADFVASVVTEISKKIE